MTTEHWPLAEGRHFAAVIVQRARESLAVGVLSVMLSPEQRALLRQWPGVLALCEGWRFSWNGETLVVEVAP